MAHRSLSPRKVWHCGRPAPMPAQGWARGQGTDFLGSAGPELHPAPWSSAEAPAEWGQCLQDGPGWPLGTALSSCSTPRHSPFQQRDVCCGTHSKPMGSHECAGNKRAFTPALRLENSGCPPPPPPSCLGQFWEPGSGPTAPLNSLHQTHSRALARGEADAPGNRRTERGRDRDVS